MTDQDAAATELEKVVASRQKEYDRFVKMQAAATVSQETVEDAAAQLAEAKARVAVRREQAVAAAGGDMLIALRKQLTDLNIAQQDRNARLKYLTQQREKLEKGLSYVDELQHAKAEANRFEQHIHVLEQQIRNLDD